MLARAELPQPRRRAGVQGAQHDDRVSGASRSSTRMAAAIRRGDLGAGARRRREPARDAARIARRVGGVRRAAEPALTRRTMPALVRARVPGRLDTRTGGYDYDRRIIAGLRDARLVGRRARARRQLSASRRRSHARDAAVCSPRFPTARSCSSTAWRSARCRTKSSAKRRAPAARRARASSAGRRNRHRARRRRRARGERAARARGGPRASSSPAAAPATALATLRRRRGSDRTSSSRAPIRRRWRADRAAAAVQLLCVAALAAAKGSRRAVPRAGLDPATATGG